MAMDLTKFFDALENGTVWDAAVAFNRNNALPLDKSSVFASKEAAEEYVSSATAYPGQVLAVVTSEETFVYTINANGELQELGGASAPMLFVADEEEMLALSDIEAGQQVYREDTHTIWLYKGTDPSDTANWAESAAQNDTVWEGTTSKVTFEAITLAKYNELTSYSDNKLYFITDAGKVCKGSTDVTKVITVVSSGNFPEVASAAKNRVYFDSTSFELRATIDGATWLTLSPGYLTDGANWAEADGNKFATISLIKSAIAQAIADIPAVDLTAAWDATEGKFSVGQGTGAVLAGVNYGAAYDESARKLTIKTYSGSDVEVVIPDFEDKFVNKGEYHESYTYEDVTYTNVIVLTIDNQDAPVIIPAEGLVDVYTADNTGKNVKVTITADNKVSAELTEEMVQTISGKLDKLASPAGGKLLLSAADGTMTESGHTVLTAWDAESSDLPTAQMVATAIANAINAAQTALNTAINNKMDKLTGNSDDSGRLVIVDANGTGAAIGTLLISEVATKEELNAAVQSLEAKINKKVDAVNGVADNLVAFGENGAIKDSAKKVGGASLASTPDENTVATEAAVAAATEEAINSAMSWSTLA